MSEAEQKGGEGQAEQKAVPRGIEVLIKKAAVDPQFRQLLLEKRAEAAKSIGLALLPSETAMLNAVSREQLETIIGQTKVDSKLRPILMGTAAGVMLAALAAGVVLPAMAASRTKGCSPDRPHPRQPAPPNDAATSSPAVTPQAEPAVTPQETPADTDAVQKPQPVPSAGVAPERPAPMPPVPIAPGGVRPDRPPATSPNPAGVQR